MSVISGTVAALEGASSEADARRANAEAAAATNAQNYQIFREGRGLYGSALLPTYVRHKGQGKGEAIMGRDTLTLYKLLKEKDPAARLDAVRGILSPFDAQLAGAERTAAGIFDGGLEREAMEAQEPVSQARKAVASSAPLEALAQTINEIKMINARKGFAGDSTGMRSLEFDARRRAASAGAEAELANALDNRGIKDRSIATRLGSLALPGQMAGQRLEFSQLPEATLENEMKRRQKLFDWFKMQPQQFKMDAPPPVGRETSAWEIAARQSAQLGNLALQAWSSGAFSGGGNNYYGAYNGAGANAG